MLFNTTAYEVDTIIAMSQMKNLKCTEVMYVLKIRWLINDKAKIYPQIVSS